MVKTDKTNVYYLATFKRQDTVDRIFDHIWKNNLIILHAFIWKFVDLSIVIQTQFNSCQTVFFMRILNSLG